MIVQSEPLADFLAAPSKLGQEVSITGKWVPTKKSGFFRKSKESAGMIEEWEAIHQSASQHPGILSTEINHAIGQDAVLVHHTFKSPAAVEDYFASVATEHMAALTQVAKPALHLVRGMQMPASMKAVMSAKVSGAAFGEYRYGYVKNDFQRPDPKTAIQVTAKWVCKPGESVEELSYWWQRVGTDAYDLEKGLVRFEVYKVAGEEALIIHETFTDTKELQFHLSKGTAHRYKKDIDKIAAPDAYFFRGPVSWTIRTYSKFLKLPATYTTQGSNHTHPAGSMSDGTIK